MPALSIVSQPSLGHLEDSVKPADVKLHKLSKHVIPEDPRRRKLCLGGAAAILLIIVLSATLSTTLGGDGAAAGGAAAESESAPATTWQSSPPPPGPPGPPQPPAAPPFPPGRAPRPPPALPPANTLWLNEFATCPNATCGLKASVQTREPTCYAFGADVTAVPDSSCAAPKPAPTLECAGTPACTALYCTVSSGTVNVRPFNDGAWNPQHGIDGDGGFDIQGTRAEALAGCMAACDADERCKAFDFVHGRRCYPKSSFPPGEPVVGGDAANLVFYWSMQGSAVDGNTRPANCERAGALPCAAAITNCERVDEAESAKGVCHCAACFPVPHCASQSSGSSCACEACEPGYVAIPDGSCMRPDTTGLTVTTREGTMGAKFAMEHTWSRHLRGHTNSYRVHPRRTQYASCKPPGGKERLIVAWDGHERWQCGTYDGPTFTPNMVNNEGHFCNEVSAGRISEFEIDEAGAATLLSDRALDHCQMMGMVTASADCSVIGVVCRSDKRPELVPGSIDLIGAGGWGTANHECKCTQVAECTVAEPCSALNAGATTTSGPCTDAAGSKAYWDRRDDSMYLIEFTGATGVASRTGSVSNPTYVCVNKAIGGWMNGHYDLSLNKQLDTYIVDTKVTIGGHEGAINLAVTRARDGGAWAINGAMNSDACGCGHPEGNKLTYSPELDRWARWCWADGNCIDNGNGQWQSSFITLPQFLPFRGSPENTRPVPIMVLPNSAVPTGAAGGGMTIVSRGAKGWIGVGYGPTSCLTGAGAWHCEAAHPDRTVGVALAVIDFPPDSNKCGSPFKAWQAAAAAASAPAGSAEWCRAKLAEHGVQVGAGWGSLPASDQTEWTSKGCDALAHDPRVDGRPACAWRFLPELPGRTVFDYGGEGMMGYPNIQRLGTDDDFLVGYVTGLGGAGTTFRIAKITADGAIGATKTIGSPGQGVGWHEDDYWARLSNGCVAFTGTWAGASAGRTGGPGAQYGNQGPTAPADVFSSTMRITTVCEVSAYEHHLSLKP